MLCISAKGESASKVKKDCSELNDDTHDDEEVFHCSAQIPSEKDDTDDSACESDADGEQIRLGG